MVVNPTVGPQPGDFQGKFCQRYWAHEGPQPGRGPLEEDGPGPNHLQVPRPGLPGLVTSTVSPLDTGGVLQL